LARHIAEGTAKVIMIAYECGAHRAVEMGYLGMVTDGEHTVVQLVNETLHHGIESEKLLIFLFEMRFD
jgi:hypothetical protein